MIPDDTRLSQDYLDEGESEETDDTKRLASDHEMRMKRRVCTRSQPVRRLRRQHMMVKIVHGMET